jgi:two-component system alkaline phosphatase synthesis response regulator PhoP
MERKTPNFSNPPRILIVEDDRDTREFLKLILEGEGYEVHTSDHVLQVVPLVKELHPNLIILDLVLPVVDGLELCSTLREHTELSHIPIFVITAREEESLLEKSIGKGANEFFSKPLPLETFLEKVKEYVFHSPPNSPAVL